MASQSKSGIDQSLEAIDSLDKTAFTDNEAGRLVALDKARALCSRLETPWESLTRIIWQEPSVAHATKLATDLGLLAHLPDSSSGLAGKVKADPALVRRIVRVLASVHIIKESEADVFTATDFSTALTKPGYVGGINSMFYDLVPTYLTLPKYLADSGWQDPKNMAETPFKAARGQTFFQWLGSNEKAGKGFGDLMAEFSSLNTFVWTEVYPMSHLTEGFPALTAEREKEVPPLIVDVGGGLGTSMKILWRALDTKRQTSSNNASAVSIPEIVVEDLEAVVVEGKKQHPELTFVTHDFFTPQPVVGARAYFLRNVLHDWPNDKARLILQNLKGAMAAGTADGAKVKSKLLLEENVVFDRAIDVASESMDFVMMGLMGAKERSESDWRELLDAVGFHVVKVWRGVGTARAVVEAELADV